MSIHFCSFQTQRQAFSFLYFTNARLNLNIKFWTMFCNNSSNIGEEVKRRPNQAFNMPPSLLHPHYDKGTFNKPNCSNQTIFKCTIPLNTFQPDFPWLKNLKQLLILWVGVKYTYVLLQYMDSHTLGSSTGFQFPCHFCLYPHHQRMKSFYNSFLGYD